MRWSCAGRWPWGCRWRSSARRPPTQVRPATMLLQIIVNSPLSCYSTSSRDRHRCMSQTMPLQVTIKSTPKDWDDVRSAFASSIMVDTSLNSLAQNLDGPEWPIKSKEDTPAKYIDLHFDEVIEL